LYDKHEQQWNTAAIHCPVTAPRLRPSLGARDVAIPLRFAARTSPGSRGLRRGLLLRPTANEVSSAAVNQCSETSTKCCMADIMILMHKRKALIRKARAAMEHSRHSLPRNSPALAPIPGRGRFFGIHAEAALQTSCLSQDVAIPLASLRGLRLAPGDWLQDVPVPARPGWALCRDCDVACSSVRLRTKSKSSKGRAARL